jgi:hypothetical protein
LREFISQGAKADPPAVRGVLAQDGRPGRRANPLFALRICCGPMVPRTG